MKQIAVIGIDLAKNVFQVHGTDAAGNAVLTKKLSRAQMIEFFSKVTPCLIGVEACSSAHYWGRRLTEMGHTVKLMPPQYVKPYVKTNKNDARDAEAICEAVTRPNMRFVPIKTEEQQAVLALHRVRDGIVKQRTALSNQIRGLLAEFGIVVAKGSKQLNACMTQLLSESNTSLPGNLQKTFSSMFQELINLTARIKEFDKQIESHVKATDECLRILQIEGVGVLTATAVVASWVTSEISRVPVNSLHGLAWFHGKTLAGAKPNCWASASAAIPICAGYWYTVRVQRFRMPNEPKG